MVKIIGSKNSVAVIFGHSVFANLICNLKLKQFVLFKQPIVFVKKTGKKHLNQKFFCTKILITKISVAFIVGHRQNVQQ